MADLRNHKTGMNENAEANALPSIKNNKKHVSPRAHP